ncbi:hypothetical protein MRS76_05505 [Rhizobiaceae bacterium n13]|uniref:Uncharacterized protein n=1 Tax=Ferirhizobium litorale TaxID=2927786 RepID=A0AAE3QAR3_9HYPH|nr:hypothetical protein [Fererhizobium litorale]MDI7861403.1 hypothetical protein [Fererhizobium litorale]MDI7921550.1 hypothetical protein [Fererhizobium litorale]
MAGAEKRLFQTTLKRRQRFHPKREVKPSTLAPANRLVAWIAAVVVVSFLVIVALQAVFG